MRGAAGTTRILTIRVLAVLGEIRGGGPVWDVESGGTACVLVADCQWPQSRARLKPETIRVTFEEFSPTHDFFDYRGTVMATKMRASWSHPSFGVPHGPNFHTSRLEPATVPYNKAYHFLNRLLGKQQGCGLLGRNRSQ